MCLIELLCLERRPRGCLKVFFFPLLLLLVTHIPAPSPLLLFNPSFSLGLSLPFNVEAPHALQRRGGGVENFILALTSLLFSLSLSLPLFICQSLSLFLSFFEQGNDRPAQTLLIFTFRILCLIFLYGTWYSGSLNYASLIWVFDQFEHWLFTEEPFREDDPSFFISSSLTIRYMFPHFVFVIQDERIINVFWESHVVSQRVVDQRCLQSLISDLMLIDKASPAIQIRNIHSCTHILVQCTMYWYNATLTYDSTINLSASFSSHIEIPHCTLGKIISLIPVPLLSLLLLFPSLSLSLSLSVCLSLSLTTPLSFSLSFFLSSSLFQPLSFLPGPSFSISMTDHRRLEDQRERWKRDRERG